MWQQFQQFLSLIRFSHTLFALPFALLSAVLAWRSTDFRWQDLVGILLCMIFARSAAMAFNRLADRKVDADNPRTAGRHLPAGLMSVKTVTLFTLLSCIGFIASTLIFLPKTWPITLSVPVLLFLLGYSYAKRFTSLCHYWLSAALMMSPIAAWLAITDSLSLTPFLLAAVIFFWVGGFDIIYACQDSDYDRQVGLKSIPARFGNLTALRIAFFSHLITIGCLFALWHFGELGWVFLGGISLVSLLLIYEHSVVRADDLSRVNLAFFRINAVISVGLLGVGFLDVLVG
ncbi:MAG: UbiA-like polyprenyltransferase [Planctomycetaceae bacterium]|jgi:4-hydroxybenzoate polyprenyltransferase|nr:putative 4-hydroxybenzoate polyprenyltransferase [bacterium]MDC0273435.1 putative 4-hydroxybenzoate polyprenyltransferase [Planctomycetaceae bacterium]MDG2388274.1 UbiA-like polyprenyltransferase [Planctomycetaceae bacterium]